MKRLIVFAITLLTVISTYAIPAKKVWRDVKLSNGNTITVMMTGDEHGHWYVDKAGKALTISNGVATYLTDSELSIIKAKRSERATKIAQIRNERLSMARTGRAVGTKNVQSTGRRKAITDERTLYSGSKKGIVLLVEFADKKFSSKGTQEEYDNMFNQEGYSSDGHIGSVHDYFHDQSYGIFDLTFDVVGPLTASKNASFYGQNDRDGDDLYPCTLVEEAIELANKTGIDFSKYDWDGDGEVDQVFVIYAGKGENDGGGDNSIWPHEWLLSQGKEFGDGNGAVKIDGVTIDTYAVSSELAGASGTYLNGIGTACHEFAHCLGYPDLYDVDYSNGSGMMNWDLLDSGSYNGPNSRGEVPSGFTAYERWMAGWLEPTVLNAPCEITGMPALVDESSAYIIYNDGNDNECYMLENRQAKRWDAYVGGKNAHGMLILHIDYNASVWEKNQVNDAANHQRLTFVPADNSYGTLSFGAYSATASQIAGDPFPGTSRKTAFTDTTIPAATLFNANADGRKFLGKPITDISESNDGLISFKFMGGEPLPDAPLAKIATEVTDKGFVANWEGVENAESYTLKVYKFEGVSVNESKVLSENCNDFLGTSTGSDGSADISSSLDNYTNTPGWLGTKIYEGPHRIKLGSSKAPGVLVSPALKAPEDGNVTISFDQSSYSSDTKMMTVSVIDASASAPTTTSAIASEDVVLTDNVAEGKNTIVKLSGVTGDYRVRFTPIKRAYIYGVRVYNGDFSEDEINSADAKKRAPETIVAKDTITISGITDTHYAVTLDNPGNTYRYVVNATVEGKTSLWSAPVTVELLATGIKELATEQKHGATYNLNGQRITGIIPSGIYIRNGKKFKID